jgi:hypothetical protein
VIATGSASVTASPIMAVGGVPASDRYTAGTQILPYASVQDDPLAHLPDPAPSNCQPAFDLGPQDELTIGPGEVCYGGGEVKGTLTLRTGTTLYVNGGTLNFTSQARVSGTNVTIVLTSTNPVSNPASIATMNMNGGPSLNLTAPTTGTYANILFYQDRRAPLGNTITMNGNSESVIQGAVYFPRSVLDFSGTTGMTTRCIQLIALRLEFSGNGSLVNDCPVGSPNRGHAAQYVRLVA